MKFFKNLSMRVDFMTSTFVDLAKRETRCELIYRFLSFKISNVSLFITSAFFLLRR